MKKFNTPAYQAEKDFKQHPHLEEQLENAWSNYVKYCTINSIMGNPWSSTYDHPRSWYYDPLVDNVIPTEQNTVPIQWNAFPNRINHYFTELFTKEFGGTDYEDKLHELADIGPAAFGKKYNMDLTVPKNPCDSSDTGTKPFGPSGPRGWQDEYCEWAVTRDENGDIIAVDFTHENPEYWFHMWKVSPDIVVSLYQEILNNKNVKKEDLYLLDSNGNPVIVRETGEPAYNPINKWNNGPHATPEGGGAVHLTSPPNSLGAEIYLGAAATILRVKNNQVITDANTLICAAQYGQIYRNSDPRIGQNVNSLVYNHQQQITLTNPIALYGQVPDFDQFEMPATAGSYKIEDCYTVVRGEERNKGITFYPFNMLLHTRFSVPKGASFKLSEIKVKGKLLKWGSQIADTFFVQLAGTGKKPAQGEQPEKFPPVGDPTTILPNVQYLLDNNLLQASLYNKLNTFSNLTSCITQIEAGTSTEGIAVLTNAATKETQFDFGPGISVAVTDFQNIDEDTQLFLITITTATDTSLGEKPLSLYNNASDPKYTLSGVLEVVPHGSLPKINTTPNLALLSGQQVEQVKKILK
ncbi:hypothetical protein [Chryseobacterium sp.]|uniref:hypothetical protein n=1 Tax=unclassified Chryseobacterium TaxID=2593645 RepID=UPI0028A21623|nr:hypothetical protein [Chryseobacterium sp.]